MNNVASSFTPVRRREETIRSHNACPESSQQWTAARCSRLLRPIRSKIDLLRKESNRPSPASISNDYRPYEPSLEPVEGKTATTDYARDADQDWGHARKRARRTYGGRNRTTRANVGKCTASSQGQSVPGDSTSQSKATRWVPGQITIPTPILSRSRLITLPNECPALSARLGADAKAEKIRRPQARYVTKDGDAHHELAESLRTIRKATEPTIYSLYDGLYNALETLLKVSNENVKQRPTSLFSTCLRAVPRQIRESEAWMRSHAEEQGYNYSVEIPDLSTETYEELESLGTSDRGWRHLKTVVRAHGVQLISDAVVEGLIDTTFTIALVKLCIHTASLHEAENILDSLLSASKFPAPVSAQSRFDESSSLLPMLALEEYLRYTGREAYFYYKVSELCITGCLPLTWLASSQFSSIWTRAFKIMSLQTSDCDILDFMATVLPLMAHFVSTNKNNSENGLEHDLHLIPVLDATLASILTTVAAIRLLSDEQFASVSSSDQQEHRRSRGNACVYLLRSIFLDRRSGVSDASACLLAISNLTMETPRISSKPIVDARFDDAVLNTLQTVINSPRKGACRDEITRIVTFICSISQCCGRGAATNGFEYLQVLLSRMQHIVSAKPIAGEHILRQVIVDSAYDFARLSANRKHLEYAEALASKLSRQFVDPVGPLSANTARYSGGVRWEEGISEWVTATPAVTRKTSVRSRMSSNKEDDESDCETPLRPKMKRRKLAGAAKCSAKTDISNVCPQRRSWHHQRISDFAPRYGSVHEISDDEFSDDICRNPSAIPSKSISSYQSPEKIAKQIGVYDRPTFTFEIEEDSEDELCSSLVPTGTETSDDTLQELHNTSCRLPFQSLKTKGEINPPCRAFILTEDSEDELG